MRLFDWLIVIIPVAFVIGMGFYSRKYICGVKDFLAVEQENPGNTVFEVRKWSEREDLEI